MDIRLEAFPYFRDYHYPFREHEYEAEGFRTLASHHRWIRGTREARFLSLQTVAATAELAPSTLARLERREHLASIPTLKRLAEALDCELVYGFKPKRSIAREIFDKLVPYVKPRVHEKAPAYALRLSTQMQNPKVRKAQGWSTVKGGTNRWLREFF